MTDMRTLMESLRKIDETDLVPYVPGQGYGVRFPKLDDDEVVDMAKFAIEMAMQNNGGNKDQVMSWIDANIKVPGEVKMKMAELLGTQGYKVGDPHPTVKEGFTSDDHAEIVASLQVDVVRHAKANNKGVEWLSGAEWVLDQLREQ